MEVGLTTCDPMVGDPTGDVTMKIELSLYVGYYPQEYVFTFLLGVSTYPGGKTNPCPITSQRKLSLKNCSQREIIHRAVRRLEKSTTAVARQLQAGDFSAEHALDRRVW